MNYTDKPWSAVVAVPPNLLHKDISWTMEDKSLRAGELSKEHWSGTVCAYKININHPELRPIYERFHRIVTGQALYPTSDAQRFEFERMVFSVLCLYDRTKEDKIRMLKWEIENIPRSTFWVKVRENPVRYEPIKRQREEAN